VNERSTQRRLDLLFKDEEPWSELERITRQPPADLLACLRERLPRLRGAALDRSVELLAGLGAAGQPLLIELLGRTPKVTASALVALTKEGTRLDYEGLSPWLDSTDAKVLRAAIGAAGFVDDPRLVRRVFAHWHGERRLDVALCLGRMRATEHTADLVDLLAGRLDKLEPSRWEFVAVALESMADPAAIPALRRLLREAPERRVWSLVQILRAASREDRLADWISPEQKYDVEALRRAWLAEESPPLGVRSFTSISPSLAELLLCGTSRVRMGYPLMVSAGSWPRWSRALTVDGTVLYHANSDCPTCETFLAWAGAERPRVDADQVGQALAHVPELSAGWLRRIEPALTPLPSGRAYVALTRLDLERIDGATKERSWYAARDRYRESDDPDCELADLLPTGSTWPGIAHYQAKALIRRDPPTAVTVMPTQSLDDFDEAVIAERMASFDAGRHPAALALGWFEHRDIVGEFPEAVLQLVVLDGHHTVEAYARRGLPARLVVVAPFAFGAVRATREHLAQLAVTGAS